MIFSYCKWVSSRWQCSVDLYKLGKRQHKRAKIRKKYKNNTKLKNTQNKKQKYKTRNKHKKNIKNMSSN